LASRLLAGQFITNPTEADMLLIDQESGKLVEVLGGNDLGQKDGG